MSDDTQNQFPWIELAAFHESNGRRRMDRNKFVLHNDHAGIAQWRAGQVDSFRSVGYYSDAKLDAPAIVPFFADIDARDQLDRGRDQLLRIVDLLHERLEIDPHALDIAFSGGGFHLVIPLAVFGAPVSQQLSDVWRSLALRLSRREDCDLLDLGIYTRHRLRRLTNTLNSKWDRWCIPLEAAESASMTTRDVLELAEQPRDFDSAAVPQESPKAIGWLNDTLAWIQQRQQHAHRSAPKLNARGGWRVPACIRRVEQAVVLPDGVRHRTYLEIARFLALRRAHPDEILERLKLIDARNPIRDPDYLERLARDAAKYAGFSGCPCPHEPLARHCEPTHCPFASDA